MFEIGEIRYRYLHGRLPFSKNIGFEIEITQFHIDETVRRIREHSPTEYGENIAVSAGIA
jgi:hypothetical protein